MPELFDQVKLVIASLDTNIQLINSLKNVPDCVRSSRGLYRQKELEVCKLHMINIRNSINYELANLGGANRENLRNFVTMANNEIFEMKRNISSDELYEPEYGYDELDTIQYESVHGPKLLPKEPQVEHLSQYVDPLTRESYINVGSGDEPSWMGIDEYKELYNKVDHLTNVPVVDESQHVIKGSKS